MSVLKTSRREIPRHPAEPARHGLAARETPGVVHALSFDIEEWFHLVGVEAMADRSRWGALERTVEPLTDQILSVLSEHAVKGTFFVLGWVAERYPGLVRRIAEAGHEVGSHSYWHREVYEHTPATFREDLKRSIGVLEDACGQRVLGYRAPSFSLTRGCEWAWDVMLDQGLRYDASVFPVKRAHGGYPLERTAHASGPAVRFDTPSGRSIQELPMSVMRLPLLGKQIAFSGGGYLRVLPWWLVKRGFAQHESAGRSAVLYLHPWDFAASGPSLPMRRFQRFKCYHHRDQTERRLRDLMRRHRFGTCASVMGIEEQSAAQPFAKAA
ncbi:MAG: polysaccharide deacetylase family protein [Phycisphaeraceae bacterium]|nr:polysaccharide deacetylase family protein [Phycisphaeraceae bacterium]